MEKICLDGFDADAREGLKLREERNKGNESPISGASHRDEGRTTTTDASTTPAWRDAASPQQ